MATRRQDLFQYGVLDGFEEGRATWAKGVITFAMLGTGSRAEVDPVGIDDDSRLQRSHLIAKDLGGSGKILNNIVPLYRLANISRMRKHEIKIRNAVFDCQVVDLSSVPAYGSGPLPESVKVTAYDKGFVLDPPPVLNVP